MCSIARSPSFPHLSLFSNLLYPKKGHLRAERQYPVLEGGNFLLLCLHHLFDCYFPLFHVVSSIFKIYFHVFYAFDVCIISSIFSLVPFLRAQAEGCTMERWNTHKDLLRENFARLVDEARAQCEAT